jgi:hypothetical protein
MHRPDLVDILERYDEDGLLAGAAPVGRLLGVRRARALAPRHTRSGASPPLRHPALYLNLGHDTILDVREGGIRRPLHAPSVAA